MPRKCSVSGVGPMSGHNVSHAKNKTKRRFLPNLQTTSFFSEVLGKVKLKITVRTLRSIEHNGGLDAFLMKTSNLKLSPEAKRLKRRLVQATLAKAS